MTSDENDDYSFDYDENETIDDELDSILSGDSGRNKRQRNIPEITLHQLLTKRRRCIHFIFRRIIIISFIPTFIYNIFWIIKMKTMTLENKLVSFDKFRSFILKVSYIFLFKGFFILFIPQILCGSEKRINDFSYSCVFLKLLTSFALSLYLTSHMEKKLELDKNFRVMDTNNKNQLNYWINLYYRAECAYIKGVISFILIILSVIVIKIFRELLKAIRYSLK